jgi:hypothetical protein
MALGKKTGGRKPGSANKLPSKVREGLLLAFDGLGGVEALTKWARKNPGDFYCKLWIRLLPQEMNLQSPGPTPVESKRESDLDFARRVAFVLNRGAHELKNKAKP